MKFRSSTLAVKHLDILLHENRVLLLKAIVEQAHRDIHTKVARKWLHRVQLEEKECEDPVQAVMSVMLGVIQLPLMEA